MQADRRSRIIARTLVTLIDELASLSQDQLATVRCMAGAQRCEQLARLLINGLPMRHIPVTTVKIRSTNTEDVSRNFLKLLF